MTNNFHHNNIDLFSKKLLHIFLADYRKIIIGSLVGGAFSLSLIFFKPIQFVASTNIETAKVAKDQVETVTNLIAKVKYSDFFSDKTLEICQVYDAKALLKKLEIVPFKDSSFAIIIYKSSSHENSQNCLKEIVDEIIVSQNRLANKLLNEKIKLLEQMKLISQSFLKIFEAKNINKIDSIELTSKYFNTNLYDISNLFGKIEALNSEILLSVYARQASAITISSSSPSLQLKIIILFIGTILGTLFATVLIFIKLYLQDKHVKN
jgi:hypothetical protein